MEMGYTNRQFLRETTIVLSNGKEGSFLLLFIEWGMFGFMQSNQNQQKENWSIHLWILTVTAVQSLPAWIADLFPTFSTSEVTKGIIPRATKDRTAFSIVMLITHKSVGVLEVSATTGMQVTGPFFPNSQMSLCSQTANETIWILWRGRGRAG